MTYEEFKTLYKEHFGKNPRKDRTESCITQLSEKLGQTITLSGDGEIPPEPDPGENPPAIQSTTGEIPPEPDPGEDPPAFKPVEVIQTAETRPPAITISGVKSHRVYHNGVEKYLTGAVIKVILRNEATAKSIQFPEDTEYVSDQKLNKCKSC